MLFIKPRIVDGISSWFTSNGFPWAVLVIMLVFSTGLWHYTESVFIDMSLDRFNSRVENQKNLIVNHFNAYKLLLQSTARFIAANDTAYKINWPTYFSAFKQEKSLTGMQSMGFIPVDTSGNPILDSAVSDDYSELITTLAQAQDTAKLTLSPRLTHNKTQDKADFLFVFPVYRNNLMPASVELRRKSVTGFVYISFHVTSFIQGVFSGNEQSLDIELFDCIAAPEYLMFSSRNIAVTPRYASRKELNIGGQLWTLHILSKPEFEAGTVSYLPLVIRFGGIAVSLLLFFLLFLNIERQRTIRELIVKSAQKNIHV